MNHLSKYLVVSIICSSTVAMGQDDFANLPSKKRISIAQQEETDAKNDAEFQLMMVTGHDLFKAKHYLKAIHKYEEAQVKRPYNVYPKVIISDIELSMKDTLETLRKAEELTPNVPPTPSPKEIAPTEMEPKSSAERMQRMDEWEEAERLRRQKEREAAKNKPAPINNSNGEVATLSMEDFQKDLGNKYPTGTTEEITTEGNRTTTKRIIVAEGKGNEYKKVVHSWGGVFYFKNGEAVTERVWTQETEK